MSRHTQSYPIAHRVSAAAIGLGLMVGSAVTSVTPAAAMGGNGEFDITAGRAAIVTEGSTINTWPMKDGVPAGPAATILEGVRSMSISGSRTVADRLTELVSVDGGQVIARIPFDGSATGCPIHELDISGPYIRVECRRSGEPENEVFIYDSRLNLLARTDGQIFGSLLATSTKGSERVEIRDLAMPSAPAKTYTTPGATGRLAGLYGPWITRGAGMLSNLETGRTIKLWEHITAVGDGYAITERYHDNGWDLGVLRADGTEVQYWEGARMATDGVGGHYVRSWDGAVTLVTHATLGRSAPRVLGVVASSTLDVAVPNVRWTPEIDSTKALGTGQLVFRSQAGVTVASIPTTSTTTGSVRGSGWDGKGASGLPVPNGTYTWEFVANAADGTGQAVAVDGSAKVTGSVTVKNSPTVDIPASFSDVPKGTQFFDEIQWLFSRGISTGWDTPTGKEYRPLQPVNRDAMAAFMYRMAGSPAYTPPARSPFVDVTPTTQFYKEISWLATQGITTGWDTPKGKEFRPVQQVNRDAMAAFMYRYKKSPAYTAPSTSPFIDIKPSTQFYKEISWLAAKRVSTGWTTPAGAEYRPVQPVNRDAMAAFMYRLQAA